MGTEEVLGWSPDRKRIKAYCQHIAELLCEPQVTVGEPQALKDRMKEAYDSIEESASELGKPHIVPLIRMQAQLQFSLRVLVELLTKEGDERAMWLQEARSFVASSFAKTADEMGAWHPMDLVTLDATILPRDWMPDEGGGSSMLLKDGDA